MSNINQIQVDSATYDIEAKALDSTLDATILKNSNLVNGFTQDTAGVNALDAAAGKTLYDEKAPTSHASSETTYGQGTSSNYGHVKLSDSYTSSGGAASAGVAASSKAVADAFDKHQPLSGSANGTSTSTPTTTSITVDFSAVPYYLVATTHSSYAGFRGLWAVTSGSVYTIIQPTNDISVTTGTNKINIANGASSSLRYFVF